MNSIGIVIPFFGPLPACFPYFIASAGANSTIDFLLFTDANMSQPLPGNIKVFPFSLTRFGKLASARVGTEISIIRPFKLCDFRPAFGVIFEDYLRQYEFWGFADLDVVFGDLQLFFQGRLDAADVISCRSGWVSGSLALFRNQSSINSLYRHSADWKTVFHSSASHLFDELGGFLYKQVASGVPLESLQAPVESFTHVIRRFERAGTLRCVFQDWACENLEWSEALRYEKGHLVREPGGTPVMYLHMVVLKRRFFYVPPVQVAPERYYIRRTGIYAEDNSPTFLNEAARVVSGGLQVILRKAIAKASH